MMKTGTLDELPGFPGPVPVIWFSKREARLLRLILEAKTPKEIASLLFLSDNTVRGHIADLGRGIGQACLPPRSPLSSEELIVWAMRVHNALRPGPVVLQDHPQNCPCGGDYCRTMFVVKQ